MASTDPGDVAEAVDLAIEALTVYGDLIELPARDGEGEGMLLYLAPPSFVSRESGLVLLFGVAPDGNDFLPDTLSARILHIGHTRRIQADPEEDLQSVLTALGLVQFPERLWWNAPTASTAGDLLARYDRLLDTSHTRGDVAGLQVLDPERSVRYYQGRWTTPDRKIGRFVGRRQQRYGAPLWSYVELSRGEVVKLLDILPDAWRACDHAWYLQLAIDHSRGVPQVFRIGRTETSAGILDFFSPVPRWARRRWDLLGEPVDHKGALFSYRLPDREYEQEKRNLSEQLWLKETD